MHSKEWDVFVNGQLIHFVFYLWCWWRLGGVKSHCTNDEDAHIPGLKSCSTTGSPNVCSVWKRNMYIIIISDAMNKWKTILIRNKYVFILLLHGWLPSGILWRFSVNFLLLWRGKLQAKVIALIWMSQNLCEVMLIAYVARRLCLCPGADRRAAFHQGRGWRAAVRGNCWKSQSSQHHRPHERSWQPSFRPGLDQQECVYACVFVCVCVFLANYKSCLEKTGSYD